VRGADWSDPPFATSKTANGRPPKSKGAATREKLWASKLLRVNCEQVLRRPVEPAAFTRQVDIDCVSPAAGSEIGLEVQRDESFGLLKHVILSATYEPYRDKVGDYSRSEFWDSAGIWGMRAGAGAIEHTKETLAREAKHQHASGEPGQSEYVRGQGF